MAACEKCWADAFRRAYGSGRCQTDEYQELIEERKDNPCTPEEQCGEMHLVLEYKDGRKQCRCGKKRE